MEVPEDEDPTYVQIMMSVPYNLNSYSAYLAVGVDNMRRSRQLAPLGSGRVGVARGGTEAVAGGAPALSRQESTLWSLLGGVEVERSGANFFAKDNTKMQ